MSLIISGATLIDAVTDRPVEGRSIWIEGSRIKAIGAPAEIDDVATGERIDARGKFVIPGLMNANVHLLGDARLEVLSRFEGRYSELIAEAAQVALRGGVTTVFDTWGPRRFLIEGRERIAAGEWAGARIFCAGNIVGLDGPFSADFYPKAVDVASPALVKRVNAIWAENVGRHLMWQTPERVVAELRAYLSRGIDFVKYASNDHFPGAFLAFSPHVQQAMVDEAHRFGLTAQAHTMSVEGLRVAVEAGCDLIQHANITGPVPIPPNTIEEFARRRTGAVIFTTTARGLEWILKNVSEQIRASWVSMDVNARNFIAAGVPLLLANDGGVFAPELASDRAHTDFWTAVCGDVGGGMYNLSEGHFSWCVAMEEKGCKPIEILRGATRNIAVAYGKDADLGTVEPGKIADLLILARNPFESAAHYRSLEQVIQSGRIVDRTALPTKQLLTCPLQDPVEEEERHTTFFSSGAFPGGPSCMHRR